MQRSKAVRHRERADTKGKVHFLKNSEREEWVRTPKIDETTGWVLTPWRRQKEEQSQGTERNRPRRTHLLETAQGGTSQDAERNRPSDAHSPPGDPHRERQVKTRKETDRAMRTHKLETAQGGTSQERKETDRAMRTHPLETAQGATSQDTEKNRPSERHSLPGDHRGRNKSEHGN